MTAAPASGDGDRSRSPVQVASWQASNGFPDDTGSAHGSGTSRTNGSSCKGGLGSVDVPLQSGQPVQFWYEADPAHRATPLACPLPLTGCGPQIRQSHGWLEGTLTASWSLQNYELNKMETWPFVLPSQSIMFKDRTSHKAPSALGPRRLQPWRVRLPSSELPELSLLLVRWNGEHQINAGVEGDGGWGKFGCPPCDDYVSCMVSTGVYGHPALGGADRCQGSFEIFSLFVKHSRDMLESAPMAPWMVAHMKGRKKVSFWLLWPAEWEDAGGADYAGYIEKRAMFGTMRAYEAAGLRSGFPHPADLYELITSKSWLCSLALHPQAHCPAATLVSKGSVTGGGAAQAARKALTALEQIRRRNPFPCKPGERPAPSNINKNGVQKGVVKLGWSWEGRFVLSFESERELAQRLTEILTTPGCMASTCIVQEWVDFDFEMRLYFLPPDDWQPGVWLAPAKVECNSWGGFSEEGRPHTFRKLTEEQCLEWWEQDVDALKHATTEATELGQFLLAWLLCMDAQPVPMVRMDFMISRLGKGQARVVFGEYCELGACCLAWENGPPTIWRAALDSALK